MSAEKKLATSDQTKSLLEETIKLMDRKGHRYVTGPEVYWRGANLALPENIRKRIKVSEESAQNFHVDAIASLGATAIKELAIITFIDLNPTHTGLEALRYKILPLAGLQNLSLECHQVESILPKIPKEIETDYFKSDDEPGGFPTEGFDNPAAFVRAMFESASVNVFRHEIESAEREAKTRASGKFVTTAAEADELIVLVRDFAEN
jgi:hypothetical protein